MKSPTTSTPCGLFNVMTPYLDKDGNVTYSKTSQSRNLVQASKTAHKRGGRVVEVDGHSNRIVCDFWAGSEIESRVETMLKAERTTYKSWKLSHNCAQLFTS